MRTVRISDENIVTVLNLGSLALLALFAIGGVIFISGRFAAGVLLGGVLAIANFNWQHSIIKRALLLSTEKAGRFAQARYVLRLTILALLIWCLIVRVGIDPIGLLLGLSVLVVNIFALTFYRFNSKGG
jgi:hypothetical protein